MQIFLVDKTFEENNSKDIHFQISSTISSWIIDFYFQEIHSNKIILNFYQMFDIYRKFQSNIQLNEFFDYCQKKLFQINKTNSIIIQYENYLNHCDLIDIFDVLHQCQIESKFERIFLSKINIQNPFDEMIFQYWSTASIKISDFNFQAIEKQIINEKNQMKSIICSYLALILNIHNDYALVHCLEKESKIKIPFDSLSRNENLSIYQIFSLFIRQKDLFFASRNLLEKNYDSIKEFIDFIEQLRTRIEQTKTNFQKSFHQLIELICKRIENIQQSFIDEFSQNFLDCISSRSDEDFIRLLTYFQCKQINNTIIQQTKSIRKCRSFDLSIIYETSFEIESISTIKRKRQPLREIHVNTFDSIEHQSEFIQLKLISDEDKENIPIITRKRMKLTEKKTRR